MVRLGGFWQVGYGTAVLGPVALSWLRYGLAGKARRGESGFGLLGQAGRGPVRFGKVGYVAAG